MGLGHARADLQAVSQCKLEDAQLLLNNRRFSNAYYLAGYAIEIGLKACVAAQFGRDTIPDLAFVKSIYQHNLPSLIGLAGLSAVLREKQDADDDFGANWATVCEWKPEVRYQSIDALSSQQMIEAIIHDKSGVFPWIKQYW
jgi:hypothetical protein